jgi:putative acetyltransferase
LPVIPSGAQVRDPGPDDAQSLTRLHVRSRAAAMPWLRSPHDETATRWWMQHVVLAEQRVRVVDDGRAVGFAALDGDWLEQLYVDPDHQGQGRRRALLEDAKRLRPGGLRLHVFTRNARARRFYEAAGFVLVGQSDGRGNEEQEPDCTYLWTPPTPPRHRS